ncbi:high mobility group box domain-containing protein [Umbelopsis sp. AD052]|nr:high mobility group box domain-containing protein [Umbelopsis sp. AD052]
MSTQLALSFRSLSLSNRRLLTAIPVSHQRGLKTQSAAATKKTKTTAKSTTKVTTKKTTPVEKPKVEKARYKDSIFAALPKRPHSAWQIYLTDQLPNMQHNGKISVASATSELGPQWRSMSEQEKQPYLDRWAKQKEEWTKKREAILAKATPFEIYRENLLRKKLGEPLVKDPNAPKKAKNGYMFYVEELRNTGQADYSQGIAQHAKVAGVKWAGLSESEKKKYLDLAQKDSERYHEEIKSYNAKIHAH